MLSVQKSIKHDWEFKTIVRLNSIVIVYTTGAEMVLNSLVHFTKHEQLILYKTWIVNALVVHILHKDSIPGSLFSMPKKSVLQGEKDQMHQN